ncbi:MAG: pyrroline-5-carboxylate reductase [Eubacterium sp.]|nr:pyrroline-5-carboxylate reductase [Eubacterium sp.]
MIGLIGCGNMGGALLGGMLKQGYVSPGDVRVSDVSEQAVKETVDRHWVRPAENNRETAEQADVLILAVKPQFLKGLIAEIRDHVRENTVVVTLAPGKTLAWLEEAFGRPVKLIRTMPNTPALVGKGMTALCPNGIVSPEELQAVEKLFSAVGRTAVLSEELMDTVTGVSGSSPAYVFMFIEAMADAAVLGGMPRQMAYDFAAQSVLGSAAMVLESGKHPAELKDMVCSPGGTTIEAVRVLEECGFRSAVIEAVTACCEKSKMM